jgi:tetratricopeptide (TPR) repeat protein
MDVTTGMEPMGKSQFKAPRGGEVVQLFRAPFEAERLYRRAMALDERKDSWELAQKLYREVVRLAPRHIDAWNNLGVMCHRLKDLTGAMQAWAMALLIDDRKAETHNNIGQLLQCEKKFEVASVYLLRAVKLDPEMAEARVNLALCLQAMGRRRAALKHWRAYLEQSPSGVWAELAKKHVRLCSAR